MPCYSAKDSALATKVTAVYYNKDNVRHRVSSHLLYFNASTGDLLAVSKHFIVLETYSNHFNIVRTSPRGVIILYDLVI